MYNRDFSWECNECGSQEFTSAVSEEDVHEWLACSSCGGSEFHKAYHEEGDDIE